MTDDLITWLRAQLDEDEQIARAATAGPWRVDNPDYAETIYSADDSAVIAGGRWGGEASVFEQTADAIHIARHDPARVLGEVEAKRAIIDLQVRATEAGDHAMHTAYEAGRIDWLDEVLSLLALPYADRPGYREEWRP